MSGCYAHTWKLNYDGFANYLLWVWHSSDWEINDSTIEDVGAKMAKFAIQSLAMMVRRNPPVRIVGSVPYLGSRLVVFWEYFIALLSCIVGVHFALFAVTVLWVTKVAKDVVISKFVEVDLRNESQVSILRQETE